jgi:hypothetical protein
MKILIQSRAVEFHNATNNATESVSGATQQMAQYVPYYALVTAPLHKLTRKDQHFPIGSKWIKGSDYGQAKMFSNNPKRIEAWLSKVWTPYGKQSLPISIKKQ